MTTHWTRASDVAERFPKLNVSHNELFIKDGRFYTSAGVTSGIDLALSMIEEDLGPSRALAVARELVVYMKRQGGQEQFFGAAAVSARGARSPPRPERLRDRTPGTRLVGAGAGKAASHVHQAAERLCRRELGQAPAALVQRLRLDDARRRLLEPGASVDT